MSLELLKRVSDSQKKPTVVDVRSGDTVKVYQRIKEGGKERVQMFEGTVIRVSNKDSNTARITVRKVTSGVGVEKSYLLHSPLVEKIVVTKRSKVRRNSLNYLRDRRGKGERLKGAEFDREAVNEIPEVEKSEVETKTESEAEAESKNDK